MNTTKPHRIFPIIKKGRYFNDVHDKLENIFFKTIPLLLCSLYQRKKRLPENINKWFVECSLAGESKEPSITWIGHSTFLIQVDGISILTDPVFSDASFLFPRIIKPGIELAQLPCIDLILLSHNHPDHCEVASLVQLQKLYPQVTILVAQGDKAWLAKQGLKNIHEFDWWTEFYFKTVKCMFLPARHWSARSIFDRNKSLWGSWMIQSQSKSIYFAGDTAYWQHFKAIAQEFCRIDVALLPIGPAAPQPWMDHSHMGPDHALQAFIDLNAQVLIPMHWGTFQFGLDIFQGPLEKLQELWNQQLQSTNKALSIFKIGQTSSF